jgi:hypothetical protein
MLTRRVVPPQEPPGHHQTRARTANASQHPPFDISSDCPVSAEALTCLETMPSTRQNHRLDKPFHIRVQKPERHATAW